MKGRKKKLSFLLVFAMVLTTAFGGNLIYTEPAAAVEETNVLKGLHVREWVEYEEDEETDVWKPLTMKNDAGYEVPAQVYEEDDVEKTREIPYAETPWETGYGTTMMWLEYVDGDGKITNVSADDIQVKAPDGSDVSSFFVAESDSERRVVRFDSLKKEAGTYKITYLGAEEANTMEFSFSGKPVMGFYSTEQTPESVSDSLSGDVSLPAGKENEIYIHIFPGADNEDSMEADMEDLAPDAVFTPEFDWSWDEEFSTDTEDYYSISYLEDASGPDELVYKVTIKKDVPNFGLRLDADNIARVWKNEADHEDEDPEDIEGWGLYLGVFLFEEGLLACQDRGYTVKDGELIPVMSGDYNTDLGIQAGLNIQNYLRLYYVDSEGNKTLITDPSKLSVYYADWNEEKETFVRSDRVNTNAVFEQYADGIMRISLKEPFADDSFIVYQDRDTSAEISINARPRLMEFFPEAELASEKVYNTDYYDPAEGYTVYVLTGDYFSPKELDCKVTDMNGDALDIQPKVEGNIVYQEKFINDDGNEETVPYDCGYRITIPAGTTGDIKLVCHIDGYFLEDGAVTEEAESDETFYLLEEAAPAETPSDEPTAPAGNIPAGPSASDGTGAAGTPTPSSDASSTTAPSTAGSVSTPVPTEPPVNKGDTVKVSGITYKVTSVGKNNTVTITKGKKNAKTITVPAQIKISGKAYKVTKIGAGVCKGNKKLTKLTIGKNITGIGANAYNGCTKLKTITVKTSVLKKVGKKAFYGVPAAAKAKVPQKKKAAYKKLFKKGGYSGTVK